MWVYPHSADIVLQVEGQKTIMALCSFQGSMAESTDMKKRCFQVS
jgi:hypothetical protein